MVKHEKYITVEVESFSRSMQKLFEGVAEVFASIGMEAPDCLQTERRKWQPEEDAENTNAVEDVDAGDKSAGSHTDETAAGDSETPAAEPNAESAPQKKGRKKTKESAEPSAAKSDASPDDEPPFDVGAKDSTSTPEVPDTPETTDVPESERQEETSITPEDITKIIVQKIKQNRSNNQRIGQLLKTYGVSKVSELPKSKYEAFITDLAAM